MKCYYSLEELKEGDPRVYDELVKENLLLFDSFKLYDSLTSYLEDQITNDFYKQLSQESGVIDVHKTFPPELIGECLVEYLGDYITVDGKVVHQF